MASNHKKSFYQSALKQKGNALAQLVQNAQMFQTLLELGRDSLPNELKPHLIGVFFEEQHLILQIDQQVWATQLRFYEPTILGIFQENLPHLRLTRVLVKVIPKPVEAEKPKLQMDKLSKQNAMQMRELSEHIESPILRKSLERLSQFQQNANIQTKK